MSPVPRPLRLSVMPLIFAAALSACAVNEAGVNWGPAILMPNRSYLENRVIDFVDIFTLNVGAGIGLHADLHATHALALALGAERTWDTPLSPRPREYGIWETRQLEAALGPFAWGSVGHRSLLGHSAREDFSGPVRGVQTPLDPLYQEQRDYWALGGSATLGVISAQFDLHTLQLLDFLAGLLGWDPLWDEF